LITDQKDRIIMLNRQAEKLIERDHKEIIGLLFSEIFDFPGPGKMMGDSREIRDLNWSLLLSNGKRKGFVANSKLVFDQAGKIAGVVSSFDEAKNNIAGKIRIDYNSMNTYAKELAHDLRSPLGGISGFASLLEKRLEENDPRQKLVFRILEGVKNLDKLINENLSFTGLQYPNFEVFDVIKAMDEVISHVEESLDFHLNGAEIIKEYTEVPMNFSADMIQVKQAFLYLIKNYFKYTKNKGIVAVRVNPYRETSKVRFVKIELVDKNNLKEDNSEQYESHLQGILQRLPGLNFSMVEKIVSNHKGMIDMEGDTEKGVIFTVMLPLCE
jgi:signal transduction histidine kinase